MRKRGEAKERLVRGKSQDLAIYLNCLCSREARSAQEHVDPDSAGRLAKSGGLVLARTPRMCSMTAEKLTDIPSGTDTPNAAAFRIAAYARAQRSNALEGTQPTFKQSLKQSLPKWERSILCPPRNGGGV